MRLQTCGGRRFDKRARGECARPLFCQRLEPRILLTTDTWLGTGDGVHWSDGSNWSEFHVPQAGEDVLLAIPNGGTIAFDSSAGNVNIRSLGGTDPLLISGGSLQIGGGVPSPYAGPLTITGGTLAVSNAGTTLSARGTAVVRDASLKSDNEAVLAFTEATQATGVNLSAGGGGRILFPAATSLATGNNTVQVTGKSSGGAASRIDLSHLTSFTNATGQPTSLTVSGGGELDLAGQITAPSLTLTLSDAASVLNVAAVTEIAQPTVNATAGTVNFSAATGVSGTSLSAGSGGQIVFPAANTCDTGNNTIQATGKSAGGTASRIDFSHLSTFTNAVGQPTSIVASSGGEIDLAGDVNGPSLTLALPDTASVLNVSGVTKLTSATINATGGTVSFSAATVLSGVSLSAASGGQILFPAATDLDTGNNTVQATGKSGGAAGAASRIDLSHLATLTNGVGQPTSFTASGGGQIDLAGNINGPSLTLTLSDAASVLNVAAVTKVSFPAINVTAGSVAFPAATDLAGLNLSAGGGGQILFPAAANLSSGNNTIQATGGAAGGAASRIDLSHLLTLTNAVGQPTSVTATAGGEIDLSGQVTGGGALTLTSDGTASVLAFFGATSFSGNPTVGSKNAGPVYNHGSFSTDNVTLNVTGSALNNLAGAELYGTGTLNGDLVNAGYVSPGASPFNAAGKLTVMGNYTQTPTGTLRVEIGGTTFGSQYDRLSLVGTVKATLAGTEDLYSINNFLPAVGDVFVPVLAASVTGTFSTIAGTNFGSGIGLSPSYNANQHVLTAVTAPLIATVTVNGGAAQRSAVTLLTLRFGQAVALNGSVALLQRAADGTTPTSVPFATASTDGGQTWNLTFPAGSGGSLADGVYDLTIDGSAVTLAGSGQPLGAGAQRFNFHRLYGDTDGNRTVNALDYAKFKAAFGTGTGSAGYDPSLDFDGNGTINALDYAQFKKRFGVTFNY